MPRLALAAAVLVLIAPSAARAQASGPVSLTGDVTSVFRPQAAFTQHGEAVVEYGADGHFAWSWAPPAATGRSRRR